MVITDYIYFSMVKIFIVSVPGMPPCNFFFKYISYYLKKKKKKKKKKKFISIWRIDNIWRTDNTNNLVREWRPVHGKSVVPVRWRVSKIVLLYGAMVLRV